MHSTALWPHKWVLEGMFYAVSQSIPQRTGLQLPLIIICLLRHFPWLSSFNPFHTSSVFPETISQFTTCTQIIPSEYSFRTQTKTHLLVKHNYEGQGWRAARKNARHTILAYAGSLEKQEHKNQSSEVLGKESQAGGQQALVIIGGVKRTESKEAALGKEFMHK